ncbi:hypothetical protein H2248_009065 [Termitomyces sp. 'cryptogamus']|nr:hypothetical protein H2248_009065 [Termitomyces sp. 'cryptogamus']
MTSWLSPPVIARCSRIYGAFVLTLCGVSAWDVISTLRFDLSIITRKRPFRWPMLLYFICRVCMLLHIFALAVNLNAISQIPCQQVTWISKVADAIGTCLSSFILVLRTRAVWHRDIKVTILLGLLACGQIALWCQTFRYSRAQWDPTRNVCAVLSTAPKPLLTAVFAYTMAFDFVILILCAYRLSSSRRSSTIAHVLWRDGIGYFCAAFGANLVQMIFATLGLNPVMNIMCLPFALVVSVIASTTVFRNVFTAHDSFSSEGTGPSSSNSAPLNYGSRLDVSGTRLNTSRRVTTEIPLNDYKSSGTVGAISIHRVVELAHDDEAAHTKSECGSDSLTHEEKARVL